jgi:hypothetical protein
VYAVDFSDTVGTSQCVRSGEVDEDP